MRNNERGYLANTINFGTIKGKVNALTNYVPFNTEILKPEIALKDLALNAVIAKVTTAGSNNTILIARRQDMFEDVESKATRIGGAFASCDVTEREIARIHNQVKIVRGERINAVKKQETPVVTEPSTPVVTIEKSTEEVVNPPTTVETTVTTETTATEPIIPVTHSVSHTSYKGVVESLKGLNSLLIAVVKYDSNEPDLKTDAIALWIKSLEDISDETDNADNAEISAKVERDDLFYDAPDSAEKMVVKIKNAVLASYGATSKEYKEIKGIPFIDNRKKN